MEGERREKKRSEEEEDERREKRRSWLGFAKKTGFASAFIYIWAFYPFVEKWKNLKYEQNA